MMAVSNAIGVWLHEYPVTPARVLAALLRPRRLPAPRGPTAVAGEPTTPVPIPRGRPGVKTFAHHQPASVAEAVALLGQYGGRARLNAGGTDLLGVLKDDIHADYPAAVIDLKRIPGLAGISVARRRRPGRRGTHHAGRRGGVVRRRRGVAGACRRGPFRRHAAAPRHGDRRRQPLPGGALLVLPVSAVRRRAHRLPAQGSQGVPGAAGRQPVPRSGAGGDLRRRVSVGPGGGADARWGRR